VVVLANQLADQATLLANAQRDDCFLGHRLLEQRGSIQATHDSGEYPKWMVVEAGPMLLDWMQDLTVAQREQFEREGDKFKDGDWTLTILTKGDTFILPAKTICEVEYVADTLCNMGVHY